MQDTVNKRTQEVGQMVESVINKLKETGDGFVGMVELRFERFKERMAEETNTVTALLDRSVNSMMDELEGTNEKSTGQAQVSQVGLRTDNQLSSPQRRIDSVAQNQTASYFDTAAQTQRTQGNLAGNVYRDVQSLLGRVDCPGQCADARTGSQP